MKSNQQQEFKTLKKLMIERTALEFKPELELGGSQEERGERERRGVNYNSKREVLEIGNLEWQIGIIYRRRERERMRDIDYLISFNRYDMTQTIQGKSGENK